MSELPNVQCRLQSSSTSSASASASTSASALASALASTSASASASSDTINARAELTQDSKIASSDTINAKWTQDSKLASKATLRLDGKRNGFLNVKAYCAGCRREAVEVQFCTKCQLAGYCSKGCQKRDWKRHKVECRKVEGDLEWMEDLASEDFERCWKGIAYLSEQLVDLEDGVNRRVLSRMMDVIHRNSLVVKSFRWEVEEARAATVWQVLMYLLRFVSISKKGAEDLVKLGGVSMVLELCYRDESDQVVASAMTLLATLVVEVNVVKEMVYRLGGSFVLCGVLERNLDIVGKDQVAAVCCLQAFTTSLYIIKSSCGSDFIMDCKHQLFSLINVCVRQAKYWWTCDRKDQVNHHIVMTALACFSEALYLPKDQADQKSILNVVLDEDVVFYLHRIFENMEWQENAAKDDNGAIWKWWMNFFQEEFSETYDVQRIECAQYILPLFPLMLQNEALSNRFWNVGCFNTICNFFSCAKVFSVESKDHNPFQLLIAVKAIVMTALYAQDNKRTENQQIELFANSTQYLLECTSFFMHIEKCIQYLMVLKVDDMQSLYQTIYEMVTLVLVVVSHSDHEQVHNMLCQGSMLVSYVRFSLVDENNSKPAKSAKLVCILTMAECAKKALSKPRKVFRQACIALVEQELCLSQEQAMDRLKSIHTGDKVPFSMDIILDNFRECIFQK